MGEVYLAEDQELGRKVALKFLPPQFTSDPDFKARFKREAQAGAALNHPNIITIYEIGEFQNRSYIAMEYVQGESLRELIKREKLPVKRVINLVTQVCEGLGKAHEAGIVHRDLKPGNLLINRDGQIKIVDFGLAKMQGVSKLTKSGMMMGTVPYMSPEQVRGETPDHRSDIFSLGIVLYEMLTRDLPFHGESEFGLMNSIANLEPRPLAVYELDIPQGLQNILNKALAKEVKKRYQRVEDLANDLKNLVEVATAVKNYQLLQKIGAGGMGEVFLAEDRELDRKVALKFLPPQYTADPDFKIRFKREAQMAAKLNHPNIVTIYEIGEFQNRSYIAMEYIEGESLKEKMTRGKLPIKEALDIMMQTCAGLSKAHRANVTHRDIKPANILINLDGQVKIVDFGLAKQKGVSGLTKSGAMMGTIPYMSPEQVKGDALDQRSDIFSAGVVLYELLTGNLPFKGESEFTLMTAITNKEPEALALHTLQLPAALQQIIDRALEKTVKARYQRIDELLADLKNLNWSPLATPPMPPVDSKTATFIDTAVRKNLNRRRQLVFGGFGLGFIGLVLLLFLIFRPGKTKDGAAAKVLRSIATQPAGAAVFLNEDSLGVTPLNLPPDRDGTLALRLRKTDYFTFDTSLVIQKGEPLNLSQPLRPSGRLAIVVEPGQAQVFLDGALVPPVRLGDLELTVGSHNVSIALAGYETRQDQFNLRQGANPERRYTLTRGETAPETGGMQIISQPAGATVTLNGRIAGKTPYQATALQPARYEVVVRLEGYKNYTGIVQVRPGQNTPLRMELEPLLVFGQISISSEPKGATIWLDGREAGTTPAENITVEPGAHQIVLRKKGFKDYSAAVTVEANQERRIDEARLMPVLGNLQVLVKPFGTIYLDGDLQIKDSNVRFTRNLPVKSYELKVVHPRYGTFKKTVNIEAEATTESIVDFNRQPALTVTSTDETGKFVWGEIYVDGEAKGQTPRPLMLRIGQHTIEVRRDGYVALDEPLTINLEENWSQPLKFRLKKKE